MRLVIRSRPQTLNEAIRSNFKLSTKMVKDSAWLSMA